MFLTLQFFEHQLMNMVVEVLSDNTITVSYINRQGGTHSISLCNLAIEVYQWCSARGISLSATHQSGVQNVLADALSQGVSHPTEWKLNSRVVHSIFQKMGRPFLD